MKEPLPFSDLTTLISALLKSISSKCSKFPTYCLIQFTLVDKKVGYVFLCSSNNSIIYFYKLFIITKKKLKSVLFMVIFN